MTGTLPCNKSFGCIEVERITVCKQTGFASWEQRSYTDKESLSINKKRADAVGKKTGCKKTKCLSVVNKVVVVTLAVRI